jgi:Abnormal spindle-like microcephaly-assoc'd, ASPM-SPD-2-Hydin
MKALKLAIAIVIFAVLTACGGGGSAKQSTPAQGVLSPTQLYFGNVAVGEISGTRTAVLTNQGDEPLIINRVEYDSNYSSNFQVNYSCPSTIAVGGSCTFTIVCAPVRPNNGNVTAYIYHNGSRLGGDLQWHLQTYSYLTLTCQ